LGDDCRWQSLERDYRNLRQKGVPDAIKRHLRGKLLTNDFEFSEFPTPHFGRMSRETGFGVSTRNTGEIRETLNLRRVFETTLAVNHRLSFDNITLNQSLIHF
jgi:hypothetical protein